MSESEQSDVDEMLLKKHIEAKTLLNNNSRPKCAECDETLHPGNLMFIVFWTPPRSDIGKISNLERQLNRQQFHCDNHRKSAEKQFENMVKSGDWDEHYIVLVSGTVSDKKFGFGVKDVNIGSTSLP